MAGFIIIFHVGGIKIYKNTVYTVNTTNDL